MLNKEVNLTEFDFTREPIRLEMGIKFPFPQNINLLYLSVHKIQKKYLTEKTNIPVLNLIITNKNINSIEYRLIFYGKTIFTETLQQINDVSISYMMSIVQSYIDKYKDILSADFSRKKEKVKFMKRKNSYEAYLFLYKYYTRYEPNSEQAFHWLKKASYYKVPSDLQSLYDYYSFGLGCESSIILAQKIHSIFTN